jgi:hypothetical protein
MSTWSIRILRPETTFSKKSIKKRPFDAIFRRHLRQSLVCGSRWDGPAPLDGKCCDEM